MVRIDRVGNIVRYTTLAGILAFVLTSITACDGSKDTQGYLLTFLDGPNIRARWSSDGREWKDGKFPEDQPTPLGVGVAWTGAACIAGWRSNGQIRLLTGIAAEVWSSKPVDEIPIETARSAPSIAYLGNNKWGVAFRTKGDDPDLGDRMVLRIFDVAPDPDTYLEGNFFCPHYSDSHTAGRPALVRLNEKTIVAWRESGTGRYFHLGIGEVESGQIKTWNHKRYDLTEPICSSIRSDPVLTHDHASFYLGFLCWNQKTSRRDLYILKSADGFNWGYYTSWAGPPGGWGIPEGSYVSFAGRSDGSIIAAIIMPQSAPIVAKYTGGQNGQWELMDWQGVFGEAPDYAPFALIPIGQPAQ